MMLRKRVVAIFTSLACMLSILCVFGQITNYSSQVNKVSALSSLSAEKITSQMTIGWNLGNSLDAYNSGYSINTAPSKFATCWGNPEPTKELIQTVKNAGFNTIRIPTTWYQHVSQDDNGNYIIDQTWLDYVKQVVDWAYDMDMFVILNIHHEEGIINVTEFTDETLATASQYIGDVWSQLAETFKDYDQHLIFEGMNEPRQTGNANVSEWGNGSGDDGYSWNYINTLNQKFVDTIRANGSANNAERLLMIPAYVATTDTTALSNLTIPNGDDHVAISVHAYSPYFFTMDTSEYSNHSFPGKSGWGEDYETALKTLFSNLKSVSDSKGVPIIIGEFSASDFNNTADRVEWAKCYLSYAKEANIPCVLWDNNVTYSGTDNGEAHGYFYRLTNTVYANAKDVLSAMMDTVGVTDYVLPDYKEYTPPTFSWDDIPVQSDWVELFKSEEGQELKLWKNTPVSGWEDYINENYKFALVYDSNADVELVLQGGWYRIPSSSNEDFIAYFTYDDIMDILNANNVSLEDMTVLYMSATSAYATMYGLYAIPVGNDDNGNDDDTIDDNTTSQVLGDVNLDGKVLANDFVLIKKHILNIDVLEGQAFTNADIDGNGKVMANDLLLVKKYVLNITDSL